MKTIDTKSLIIGALGALLIFSLMGSKSSGGDDNIEFVPSAGGTGIYNKQTRTLYLYKMWNLKINSTPAQIFKVKEDGSSLAEM